MIASRLRRESADLFEQSDQSEPQPEALPEVGLPTIIEVPHWLARLEPQLAALDGADQAPSASHSKQQSAKGTSQPEPSPKLEIQPSADQRPPEQQELF